MSEWRSVGFVYVVSKGGVSKIGSSFNGDKRAAKVADNLFGGADGCLIAVRKCKHYRQVEKFAHKKLSNKILSNSPVYPKETFSVSFDDALSVIDEAVEFLIKNKPHEVDVVALTNMCISVRSSSMDLDAISNAKYWCDKAGVGYLIDELRNSDELNETTACMAKTIATLLIANMDLSAGVSSLCKQVAEISGQKVTVQ